MIRYKVCFAVLALSLSVQAQSAATDADKRVAKKLYERMTGVKAASTKPELIKVVELISQGKRLEAARYITTTPDFLNVQIKNFSIRLSNKDDSVNFAFNDFAALVAGVVRDNKDFRDILTADYYYDISGVPNDDDQRTRFLNQTNFSQVETGFVDLTKALTYHPRQQLVVSAADSPFTQSQRSTPMITLGNNPEPAGIFSTRTFAERALSGGTNRRAVEYTMNQFLCVTMAEAADSNASDQYIGRDVERFPAGDYNKFLTSCKSCHSVMDAMRPAFGKMDYEKSLNGTATGTYTQTNGTFFNENKISDSYSAFLKNIFQPVIANIIPDLEINQENSLYYKTRYDFLISRGSTPAAATAALMPILNSIRDPKIATDLIADFRAKKQSVLADIRLNLASADYKTTYVATCLNNLSNKALTADVQEEKFLLCNLDNKKEFSLIYAHYEAILTAKNTVATEQTRLLGKLINRGRPSPGNLTPAYLQAKEQSMLYPSNSFDSETGIATKLNKGSYAYGFVVKSDTFVNNATLGSKSTFFGWRGGNKTGGKGIKDFGRMISESRRFSQCMAKKVYESVCGRKLASTQYSTLVRLGDRFEAVNYNLKGLYQEVALDPVCGLVKE
ncbi:hypothetical protein [Bdellovibrio svalbardensis]|uniref:DUF1592 domain-containing protein n=1 Tax=Bdellovibrio svalbardensis TaxID=2972972 RepID=A0ABT6DGZ4_9BACT|nr:hypothetical protein [Bdellovibrio svalbardensis]MDG0816127.1 hypothetical protein [Bdellovibrio svalbardensis]